MERALGSRGGRDARDRAIIFRDLVGKLDVLIVECDKCGLRGRYHLYRLIERYGAPSCSTGPTRSGPTVRARRLGTSTISVARRAQTCRSGVNRVSPALGHIIHLLVSSSAKSNRYPIVAVIMLCVRPILNFEAERPCTISLLLRNL
jgi:hypothetical protein